MTSERDNEQMTQATPEPDEAAVIAAEQREPGREEAEQRRDDNIDTHKVERATKVPGEKR